jgi:hypothetical protein
MAATAPPSRHSDHALFRRDTVALLDWYGAGRTTVEVDELADALDTDPREIETAMGRLKQSGPLRSSASRTGKVTN